MMSADTASAPFCPECGAALPGDAKRGLCPACLVRRALAPDPQDESSTSSSTGSIRLVRADGTTAPPPCSRIGDYDLLEEIGHGGMGVIYKARQRSLDRVVAVKLIRSGLQARAGDLARFQTEAAAAARLEHPNIVGIYEVGEEAGQRFYSMEFVPGSSLAGALRAGPFEPRKAAQQARIVSQAIQYAHERGVVHRDLKPSNILLDEREEPRVADFGLAKLMQGDSELTVSGAVIGSPQYMSPEQASGSSARAGVRSDVYSLGAILYELLTGRPPFSAPTPLETMKLVVEQEPIAPRALNPALPRDLETICLKCLAKEPGARYAGAGDLADELGRFLRDEPILARPVSPIERGWLWCRRKPTLAALGAVLIAAPAIIIALLLLSDARIQQEKRVTEENLYAADIALAARALETGDYGVADRSLEAHLPEIDRNGTMLGNPGPNQNGALDSKDLRGFEWRFLWAQAQGDALRTIPAHLSEVNCIIYSPDGRLVASSSPDGTAKLWDAATGEFQRAFQEPGNQFPLREFTGQYYQLTNGFCMRTVSFSADSRELLTAGDQGISAWEPGTGRRLWNSRIGAGSGTNLFTMLLASPRDPNLGLAMMYQSRAACGLINLGNQSSTALFTNSRTDRICFSPDGRQFARWDANAKRAWIQQIPSGETNATIETRETHISQMEFTADGRTLAACNLNRGRIELFDAASGQPAGQLTGQFGRLQALAISPNGKLLATGGYDHTIRLWDFPARRELRLLRGHRSPIRSLAFSPDSEHLVSGGYDGTVRFWTVAPRPTPPEITNVAGAFAFSSDGRWLVTQSADATARLFELPARRLAAEWRTPFFQAAVFSAKGELLLASCGSSNEPPCVRAWNCGELDGKRSATAKETAALPSTTTQFQGLSSPCSAVGFSPDGKILVTGCGDGTVALWEARTGTLQRQTRRDVQSPGFPGSISSVHFSANGHWVATTSSGSDSVQIWRLPDCEPVAARYLSEAGLCALSPDGGQLATAGVRQSFNVNLWSADLRGSAVQLLGHRDNLDALAYAPDGRTLATAGEDGLLKLWHLASRREIARLVTLGQGNYFNEMVFSADGTWLGASDNTGLLHLFHAPPLAVLDAIPVAPSAGR